MRYRLEVTSRFIAIIATALLLQSVYNAIHAQTDLPDPHKLMSDCLNGIETATAVFHVTPSTADAHQGVGAFAAYQIGGLVWKDEHGDGIRQLSDPFLPNATVALYGLPAADGRGHETENWEVTPLLTTTTTITGWYDFHGLVAGDYFLRFATQGHLLPTLADQGDDDSVDSDGIRIPASVVSQSAPLSVTGDEQQVRVDAGFLLPAEVTVYVYHDLNKDHQRQANEALVANSMISLTDYQGLEVGRSPAQTNGSFRFVDLLPGQYMITVQPPSGFITTAVSSDQPFVLVPGAVARGEVPVMQSMPNAVDLVTFSAMRKEDLIYIQWVTAAEYDTVGYRLQTIGETNDSPKVNLTSDLIRSQGGQGGTYTFQLPYNPLYDGPLHKLAFWLVEYETSGAANRYGPYRATDSAAPRIFLPLILR
ncbi:MAG: SdrD B-like domain-containing protein [Caldilineaceae bacterium]